MWLASADVTGERDNARIGLGPTAVLNPVGEVIVQVPTGDIGMVTADIDQPRRNRRGWKRRRTCRWRP